MSKADSAWKQNGMWVLAERPKSVGEGARIMAYSTTYERVYQEWDNTYESAFNRGELPEPMKWWIYQVRGTALVPLAKVIPPNRIAQAV